MSQAQPLSIHERPSLVALLYAGRCVWALALTLPLYGALAASGGASHPLWDTRMFEPGGVILIETLRLAEPALGAAWPSAVLLLIMGSAFSLLPKGVLLHGLLWRGATLTDLWRRSFECFPRFLLLGALARLLQTLALLLAFWCAIGLRWAIAGETAAPAGEIAFALMLLLSMPGLLALSLLRDLSCAVHTCRERSLSECLDHALSELRRHPITVAGALLQPALVCIALIVAVGFAVGALRVEQAEPWRWCLVLALHQCALLAVCLAEGVWQRRALMFALESRPSSSLQVVTDPALGDTPAAHDARSDPN